MPTGPECAWPPVTGGGCVTYSGGQGGGLSLQEMQSVCIDLQTLAARPGDQNQASTGNTKGDLA